MSSGSERESLSLGARASLMAGLGALRALALTWRIRVVNAAAVDGTRAAKQPFIFTLWHGQLLPLLWQHRDQGVAILISEHRDGEMVARAATSLGLRLIRGSTTRGGDRALISIVRELKGGGEVAITPDGPKGPAGIFAPGALIAAQRSGAYIIPVVAVADRAWYLKSWDRFMIPKPFAKVTVAYGTPAKVLATTSRGAAEEGPRFKDLMGDATRTAGG